MSLAVPVFLLEMVPMALGSHIGHSLPANLVKFVLTAIVLSVAGRDFFIRAWKAARHGVADMNTLVAIGTGSAFLYSTWAMVKGIPEVYFDTAAVVVALVLLGKWMEDRAKNRTRDTLRGLLDLVPKMATVRRADGSLDTIPLKSVRIGDLLLVKAFESVPVDGMIEEGDAQLDQSMMTGESLPVSKSPGDRVIGGTRNGATSFTFRAEKIGSDTALAGIVAAVEHAQGSKAPIQRLVDKIAAVFVPAVLVVALVTFVGFLLCGWHRNRASEHSGGADHRVSVCARTGHAHSDHGGIRTRRAERHPHQRRGVVGSRENHPHHPSRQDRNPDHGHPPHGRAASPR
jgi:cation transport ATPase